MLHSSRIGVYGGAFDPPTVGHLHVINSVLSSDLVDMLLIIPSFKHMYGKSMTSYDDRLAMCEIAFGSVDPCIHVSPIEASLSDGFNPIASKTLFAILQSRYPSSTICPIIGQDNADTIGQWVDGARLINQYQFIVIPRISNTPECVNRWYLQPPHVYMNQIDATDTSSSTARSQISNGLGCDIINQNILKYITKRGLYVK